MEKVTEDEASTNEPYVCLHRSIASGAHHQPMISHESKQSSSKLRQESVLSRVDSYISRYEQTSRPLSPVSKAIGRLYEFEPEHSPSSAFQNENSSRICRRSSENRSRGQVEANNDSLGRNVNYEAPDERDIDTFLETLVSYQTHRRSRFNRLLDLIGKEENEMLSLDGDVICSFSGGSSPSRREESRPLLNSLLFPEVHETTSEDEPTCDTYDQIMARLKELKENSRR